MINFGSPSNHNNALKNIQWKGDLINIGYNNKVLGSLWNIIMTPVKCVVDVYMKRTLHDKVDNTNFNKHLETLKYLL